MSDTGAQQKNHCTLPESNCRRSSAKNQQCRWQYAGELTWETEAGSYVKLDQVMVHGLSGLELKILGSIASYQLQHFDLDAAKYGTRGKPELPGKRIEQKLGKQFRTLLALDVRKPVGQRRSTGGTASALSSKLTPENLEVPVNKNTMVFAVEALDLDVHSDIDRFVELKSEYERAFAGDLVRQLCQYILKHGLETEGVFRKAASKKKINELKDSILYSGKVSFDKDTSVHEVACLLKEFLKQFDIIPEDVHDAFLSTCDFFHRERVHLLKLLVFQLPEDNIKALYILLKTLYSIHKKASDYVDDHSGVAMTGNKMDAYNLAIVFAPNMLLSSQHNSTLTCAKSKNLLDQATCVVKTMIEHYETLFKVPSKLHNEIMKVVSKSYPGQLNAILSRKLSSGLG